MKSTSDLLTTILMSSVSSVPAPAMASWRRSAKKLGGLRAIFTVRTYEYNKL